jgi:hypothetical protein
MAYIASIEIILSTSEPPEIQRADRTRKTLRPAQICCCKRAPATSIIFVSPSLQVYLRLRHRSRSYKSSIAKRSLSISKGFLVTTFNMAEGEQATAKLDNAGTLLQSVSTSIVHEKVTIVSGRVDIAAGRMFFSSFFCLSSMSHFPCGSERCSVASGGYKPAHTIASR